MDTTRLPVEEQLLSEVVGNEYATRSTLNLLAQITLSQGRLYEAQHLLQEMLNTCGKDLRHRSHALLKLGEMAFENNNLEAAEIHAAEAFEIAQKQNDQIVFADSSILLARIKHAQGDTAQAQRILETPVSRLNTPLYVRKLRAWQAWLAFMAGDIPRVQAWYTSYVQSSDSITTLQQEHEAFVAARLFIAQGKTQRAHILLNEWQESTQAGQRVRQQVELLILKALAFIVDKHLEQAQNALLSALGLACEIGYMRLFLQEGVP